MMPLPLPISPADALRRVLYPALELLPSKMGGERAETLLLGIALQESGLRARVQDGGTARGLWQMERIAIRDVLRNPIMQDLARKLCGARGCPNSEYSVYLALASDDILAAGIARLYLWLNPEPLPAAGDVDGSLNYYLQTWRPGAYKRDPEGIAARWVTSHRLALEAVTGADTEPV